MMINVLVVHQEKIIGIDQEVVMIAKIAIININHNIIKIAMVIVNIVVEVEGMMMKNMEVNKVRATF